MREEKDEIDGRRGHSYCVVLKLSSSRGRIKNRTWRLSINGQLMVDESDQDD